MTWLHDYIFTSQSYLQEWIFILWMKEKTYLKHLFKIINFNYNLNGDQESVVTIKKNLMTEFDGWRFLKYIIRRSLRKLIENTVHNLGYRLLGKFVYSIYWLYINFCTQNDMRLPLSPKSTMVLYSLKAKIVILDRSKITYSLLAWKSIKTNDFDNLY